MGVAFADIFAGLYGVISVQAALAERNTNGRDQQIDISLLNCMTGVLANQAMNFLALGNTPQRLGNTIQIWLYIRLLPRISGILL